MKYPPRLIRMRDAPSYLGMDRSNFNKLARPHLTEISIGVQGIAFDRLEIDAFVEDYISRNGRRPVLQHLEDERCQRKETPCRAYASEAGSGISKNAVNTPKAASSTRAQDYLAALKQKNT